MLAGLNAFFSVRATRTAVTSRLAIGVARGEGRRAALGDSGRAEGFAERGRGGSRGNDDRRPRLNCTRVHQDIL